jgi:hypothetical protein
MTGATLAADRVQHWDRDRLHAPDAAQAVIRTFGLKPAEAATLIAKERTRRP